MRFAALTVMWAAAAAAVAVAVAGQLHVDPVVKCLELSCQRLQWCSKTHSVCKNCSDVCDAESREYAQTTCDYNCQAYLHELRYQKKGESADTVELAGRVSTLTTLLALCVCGLIGCVLWMVYHTMCVHRASCRRSAVVDCNCSINEKHNKPNNNKILKLMRWGGSVSAAGTCAVTAGYNSSRPDSVRISRDVTGARPPGLSLGDTTRRLPSEDSCPAEDDGDAIYANLAFCPSPTDVSIANRPLPEPGVQSAAARGAAREVDITDMSSAPAQCSV